MIFLIILCKYIMQVDKSIHSMFKITVYVVLLSLLIVIELLIETALIISWVPSWQKFVIENQ